MKDDRKTKAQLLQEIERLRKKIVKLERDEKRREIHDELSKMLASSVRVGVYLVQKGQFVFVNPYTIEYSGYAREELIGRNSVDLIHPDDRESAKKNAVAMLKGKRAAPYEFRLIAKNGDTRWILESVKSISYGGEKAILGNSMDITEQKLARQRLEDLEALEASILDAIPIAVLVLREREILFANNAVDTVFGWNPKELVGRSTRILYRSDEEYEKIAQDFYPVLEKQRTFSEEFPCRRRDGKDIMCWVSTSRIGETLWERRIVATYQDVTERKKAEAALQDEKDFAESVIGTAQVIVLILDTEGRIVRFNPYMEDISGYRLEEVEGKDWFNTFLPELDRAQIRQIYLKAMADIQTRGNINPIITKEGKERYIEWYDKTLKDREGKVVGLLSIGQDVTERKHAEKALMESEQRLKAILEGSPTPTFIIDRNHRVIGWNRSLEEMSGISAREMIGTDRHWSTFYSRKRPFMADLLVNGTIESAGEFAETPSHRYTKLEFLDEAYESTDRLQFVGKGDRWLKFTAAAIRDSAGQIVGAVETMTDITDCKTAEEELKGSLEKLQRSMESTIQTIATIVETRDPYTAGHQKQVDRLACAIALEMGLPEDTIAGIHTAAVIHDIGKIYIPAEMLSKPGHLSEIEYVIMKTHPQVGHDILKMIEFPWPVATIVLQHHERMNGSGYPKGLSNGQILMEARIIAVADVFESMASHRPYRPTLGKERAMEELVRNRGILYDATVVDTCLTLFREKGFSLDETAGSEET